MQGEHAGWHIGFHLRRTQHAIAGLATDLMRLHRRLQLFFGAYEAISLGCELGIEHQACRQEGCSFIAAAMTHNGAHMIYGHCQFRSSEEFTITDSDLRAMAAPAIMGLSQPRAAIETTRANGPGFVVFTPAC